MKVAPTTRKEIEAAVLNASLFFHKKLKLKGAKVRLIFEKMNLLDRGSVIQEENRDGSIYYPIRINKDIDFYRAVSTAAHEMVHVKQMYTNTLTAKKGKMYWKNRYLGWIPYGFQPWEMKASYHERLLLNQYLHYKGYVKPPLVTRFFLYTNVLLPYLIAILAFIDLYFIWEML